MRADDNITDFYKTVSCIVCNGQTVYDSNTDFAKDVRSYISMRNKSGKSLSEIRKEIISNYGQEVSITAENMTKSSIFITKIIPLIFLISSLGYIVVKYSNIRRNS